MDLYNIVTKIPYVIMLGIGIVIVLQLYIGGLRDFETSVETVGEEEYRQSILLEKFINHDAEFGEVSYEYDRRRAVMPKEIFTNKDPSSDEIGHQKKGAHCYIEEIEGLDGEDFAFGVKPLDPSTDLGSNPDPIKCQKHTAGSVVGSYVSTPVQVVRGDNPPLEVRVYVYQPS